MNVCCFICIYLVVVNVFYLITGYYYLICIIAEAKTTPMACANKQLILVNIHV